MQHERRVLSNGLRIIHVPMPQMQSASIVVFVGVGSRHESATDAGTCHLIEHMLFKGTQRRPRARDISRTIESVGGVLNASTDKELTVYWSKTAREHVPLAFDLLSDMLLHSRMRPSDLAREKNIVVEELAMLVDDPQDWIHVLTDEVLWPGQPLGREIAGTRESVSSLSGRTLTHYMDRYYGSNNAVVSVAGGVSLASAVDLVERSLSAWSPVDPAAPAVAFAPAGAPRSRIEHRPNEHVDTCVAFPGIHREHPDRWGLDVLCTILGGGTSSRLFVELRERLGLVYDVHMFTNHFSDTGSIVIYAGMDPTHSRQGLEAIMRTVERVRSRGVTADELRWAQQFFRGRLALGLEDTHSVASWFGAQEMLQHEVITPEQAASAIDGVSTRDVRRIAQTYLVPAEARLTAIGPEPSVGLEELLAIA
jgi:predicted Zn-dependent peptidase